MRVHNNEIILSWLRTEDSYYTNEDWHVHSVAVKSDATGHWEECECGHKGEVSEHIFSDWSTNPVNDGEKNVFVRRCPCGYEETKEADLGDNEKNSKSIGTTTIVLICVGSCVIVAAAVVMIIVTKKRKLKK